MCRPHRVDSFLSAAPFDRIHRQLRVQAQRPGHLRQPHHGLDHRRRVHSWSSDHGLPEAHARMWNQGNKLYKNYFNSICAKACGVLFSEPYKYEDTSHPESSLWWSSTCDGWATTWLIE